MFQQMTCLYNVCVMYLGLLSTLDIKRGISFIDRRADRVGIIEPNLLTSSMVPERAARVAAALIEEEP